MDPYMLNSQEGNATHDANGMNMHMQSNAPSIGIPPQSNQTIDLSIATPPNGHEIREHSTLIPDVNKEIINNNPKSSVIFNKYAPQPGYNYTPSSPYTGVNDYSKYALNNNHGYVQQEGQCADSDEYRNSVSTVGSHVMNFQNTNISDHVQVGSDDCARHVLKESTALQSHTEESLTSVTELNLENSVTPDEKLSGNQPHKSDFCQKDSKDADDNITQKDNNLFDLASVNFYEFKCKFCSATFERRKTFKRHIINEHGILPYVCNICGIGYDHKSDLKVHIREHKTQKEADETPGIVSDDTSVKPVWSSKLKNDNTSDDHKQENKNENDDSKATQVTPKDDKSNLTKSLHLLAQVSQMRDSREKNPKQASSTVVNSDRKVEVDKPVVNKRKRGRPRRVTRSTARARKRKQGQPKKARRTGKVQIDYAEETSDEEGDKVKPIPKIKVEVRKGNYKLRPQIKEKDYSTRLENDESEKCSTVFRCHYCNIEFNSEAKMLRHENAHKDFSCTTCGEEFSSYRDMKKHEDTHFPDEMKCHFCNKAFKTKKDLWKHEETYGKTITCRWCGATYNERSELDTHERMHFFSKTSSTIFECQFCKKICKSRKSWKSHLVSHSNIRAFECEICGKKYKQQGSFNIHMQRHNNTFYKFTCQFCGKKYGQKALLIIHERTHTNERPFKCSHCDLAYPSKNQLDHHMQRVNGIKHMCSFCGKQLNSRSSLEIHERIHTGTRPIKCEFCDMDFIEASSYKYHLRLIHTGERFECKFCGKLCKARGVLNAHMRVHTGERPFKCPHCEKAFRSGNVLRTHIQGIHLGIRHKCEKCGREFAQTSALNTHKKLVHEGMKWKDIQFQRKVNRQNREQRDRMLIVNAIGKEQSKSADGDGDIQQQEPVKYMEPVNETLDNTSNEAAPSIPAYSDIERNLTIITSAPSVMASVPTIMASGQPIMASAASIMASAAASAIATPPPAMVSAPSMMVPPHSMVTPGVMPPAARPIPESDRGSVDVAFPPVISGTPMYHVL